MPKRSIVDRLKAGDKILLDGATGSELGRRGVNVSKGSTPDKLGQYILVDYVASKRKNLSGR